MRLEPVYLLAPKPAPKSVSSRRAFLFAGGAFVVGAACGGVGGYAVGVGQEGGGKASEETPESSGDALLDELRRLATTAPIEELVAKRLDFLNHLYTTYPNDVVAWRGVERLAEVALTDSNLPDRRIFSRWVAQVIEKANPTVTRSFVHLVPELRKVR